MADPLAAAPELKRIRWLMRAAFLWALVIFGKLAWLQTYAHEELLQQADNQQEEGMDLQPPRGTLETRDGAQLAVSVPAWTVILNPRKLKAEEEPETMAVLARALHLDPQKLAADLYKARHPESIKSAALGQPDKPRKPRAFLRVKSKADPAEYRELKAWIDERNKRTSSMKDDVDWLSFERESWRAYPNGELAGPLIGSVDGAEKGFSGIERTLQKELQGKPGWVRMLKDSRSRNVNALEMIAPKPGKKVTLTIDSQLQFLADRTLATAVKEKGFASGTAIVMNPNNGEIYAMSAYPGFNPNVKPKNQAEVEARVHRAVGQALDGGSVMKMFTLAGAIEHTRLRPESLVDCGNGKFYYSKKDKIDDGHAYGVMPFKKVLWLSSNIGAIHIGMELGRQKLYQVLRDLGFGQKTGVELPGESAGVLNPLERWQPSSIYFVSMGHEMGVTTVQLAQACSVIANGGYRVKPRLVLSKQAQGGNVEWEPDSPKVRVIQASTAVDMREMSEGVVLFGTGGKAKIIGRTVGGKTGTAQMIDKRGRYQEVYSSSFMGYSPLNSPKVVVVVTLNGGKLYGNDAAGPVFSVLTDAALNMLGEPADISMAAPANLAAKPAQTPLPAPESALPAQEAVADNHAVGTGAAVPDLIGLDKRSVARISAERGLPVEMTGAGVARAQSPAPGSVLAMGGAVHVRFAR